MRNILYAQLFFILIIAFVTSTKSYAFNVAKHISNVNGLTNNSVNCILEDAEHTIWIGPEQWMADPGCGYTVQTDVQLWMRDKLVEAIDIVPFGYADTLQGQAEAEENEAYE